MSWDSWELGQLGVGTVGSWDSWELGRLGVGTVGSWDGWELGQLWDFGELGFDDVGSSRRDGVFP